MILHTNIMIVVSCHDIFAEPQKVAPHFGEERQTVMISEVVWWRNGWHSSMVALCMVTQFDFGVLQWILQRKWRGDFNLCKSLE